MDWLYFGLLMSVVVAGSTAGLMLRGTSDEPRRRGGWMHPLASPVWLLAGLLGLLPLLPFIVLHSLITTGEFWSEEPAPSVISYPAGVLGALVIVALWGVVFAQWWQPLYLCSVIALGVAVQVYDPTDPSWRHELLPTITFAAAIAALAATGIVLRFLLHRLRHRYGAASVGTLVGLIGQSLGKRVRRSRDTTI